MFRTFRAPARPEPTGDPPQEAPEDEALITREGFEAGFEYTQKGSLVRYLGGLRLVVFRRHGAWRWCLAACTDTDPITAPDAGRPHYSPVSYAEVEHALEALWLALTGDE